MTGIRFAFLCGCLALVLAGCTSDNTLSVNEETLSFGAAGEEGASIGKNMVTRTFKATMDVSTIRSPGPQPCVFNPEYCAQRCAGAPVMATWVISFSGYGNGTHVGRFEAFAEHCSIVEFDPETMIPVGAVYGDGQFVTVAANGDVFSGTYGNYGVDGDGVSTTVAPGVGDFFDLVRITSGSGRFANATGVLRDDGLFDVATGAITHWTMHGQIRYAAADRSNR